MLRQFFTYIFVLISFSAFCQDKTALPKKFLQDEYSSPANEFFWKNRKPYADYWQQDVHYTIYAELNDSAQNINGIEELVYVNNSPDTLHEVFFYLYQNAFQPGSYHHDLYINNNTAAKFGSYEKQGLGIVIKKLMAEDETSRKPLVTKLNNTILQVKLPKPLPPNAKTKFYIEFTTYFDAGGNMRRRMKTFQHNGNKHFDAVQWYPKICVYDKHRKWNTDQHLNREFYGDFGTYEVHLTLPNNYIAEATGILINENDVLPKDLKEKIQISNIKPIAKGEKRQPLLQRDGSTKTWVYQAMNVHDFAWTADPSYRIAEAWWNGIKCVAIAQEENAATWQNVALLTTKVIETYSNDFGMYGWPKIVVADARDGMEYNMLTLCGGVYPYNTSLIAHEVGHMWYYGMMGSNETYRAFLDEGFTQFLTVWFMEKFVKKPLVNQLYTEKDSRLYLPYLRSATDPEQLPINTHSDDFHGQIGHGGGYGQVYYKTGVMLYNLQYVLGDSLFSAAMKYYFNKWKFMHPYADDLENAFTEFTKTDLSWFFDQWLETTKTIDYSVEKVKKTDSGYAITFKRKGEMQMPIDFTVELQSGKKLHYLIPNTYFIKKTDAKVLDVWTGWGTKVRPEYTAHISTSEKIVNVFIDTSNRLADVNMLNNRWKGNAEIKFDNNFSNYPDRYKYNILWRPDVWYNAVDGIKIGLHADGNYFNRDHFLWATAWYNTALLAYDKQPRRSVIPDYLNFVFSYSNPLRKIDENLSWFIDLRMLDGLEHEEIGITKKFRNNNSFTLSYKQLLRRENRDVTYLLYPELWNVNRQNNTVNLEWHKLYSKPKSNGKFIVQLKTSSPESDYQYASLSPEFQHNINIKKWQWKNRLAAFYTTGTEIAPESRLFLAGGNPEQMMDNKFVRSRGFVPEQWLGFGSNVNHFHFGGGMNLRGYSGYVAPVKNADSTTFTYIGNSGIAYNTEFGFTRKLDYLAFFKNKKNMGKTSFSYSLYTFFDAGIINVNQSSTQFSPLRMDAGFGSALTINELFSRKASPLIVRFDVPLYLSHAPAADPQNIKFRWLVGVERAF